MPTALFTHPVCVEHENGFMHPESPDRLRAIERILEGESFALLERHEAPAGQFDQIERVHAPFYVEAIFENMPKSGHTYLDPDTGMSPKSGEAALRAVGGLCAAVDEVVDGRARNAFCPVRPPGHHAERSQAMGFCLFNNVAVAAHHARHKHGIERVAVVDFDVHHGNGTQNAFFNDPNLFYASSHQWPCYPGTGMESDRGVAENICNLPLSPGAGSAEFREGYQKRVLPALRTFAPELLIISAGFDAHARDPLAQLRLTEDDYAWVTRELLAIAEDCCSGRVVSSLEGGYDLTALANSVAAHVRALMGS